MRILQLENGYGKRTTIGKHFHIQNRGGIGIRASKVNTKTGNVVEAMMVTSEDGDLMMISTQGQAIRLPLKSVKRLGRDTMGVTLMRLKNKDKVSSVGLIQKNELDIGDKKQEVANEKIRANNTTDENQVDKNKSEELVPEPAVEETTPFKNSPVKKIIEKGIRSKKKSANPDEVNWWGKNIHKG